MQRGSQLLEFGRGAYLIAGVVHADQEFTGRTVDRDDALSDSPDWLFEPPTPALSERPAP